MIGHGWASVLAIYRHPLKLGVYGTPGWRTCRGTVELLMLGLVPDPGVPPAVSVLPLPLSSVVFAVVKWYAAVRFAVLTTVADTRSASSSDEVRSVDQIRT